ncbi:extracellular solute-binding protein [Adlercreutzia sp. ZJ304]|uniref:molybdate ABC transporter substrate-binding protein n=1 Tax=Adlercreutzia sp. ZJ304 TaxID=2709791 RepID=UPI0013EE2D10|nr:extracellular solute-binding protein [Adlercreutzia sp. ZJ304]
MKGKFTKIVAAAASCALVAAVGLSGCAGGASSSSSSASSSAASKSSVELQVFAANSLEKAMNEVQSLYTEQTGVQFADTQYEASGTLNEMLAGGAYADALITASKATMDTAESSGYIDPASRFNMFTNDLVIVAGLNSDIETATLEDIASGNYTLAVGDANVPAGNYAKQSLTTTNPQCWISADGTVGADCSGKEGTFDGTPLEGKVTEGSSVGNVCQYANSGDVDLAMVYSSDVFRFGNVKNVGVAPADSHKNIVYPAAVCANSEYADETKAFLDWAFTSEDAIKIWQEWGFEIAAK